MDLGTLNLEVGVCSLGCYLSEIFIIDEAFVQVAQLLILIARRK